MGILSQDTSLEAEQVQVRIFATMPVARKLEILAASVAVGWRLRGDGRSRESLDLYAILGAVTDELDRLQIDYFVGGSIASTLYGEPRFTQDADVVVRLREGHIDSLAGALEGRFYVSREALREAVHRRSSANLVHFESGFKVDLMISRERDFEASRFERRVRAQDGEHSFWVATAEDIILVKLESYRMGNEISERQWRDVLAIMMVQKQLDQGYLDRWSVDLGVKDLLDRARQQVDPATLGG